MDPVLLSGEFSVSDDKKVRFSHGNLYWNGSSFEFETDKFSYPTSWDIITKSTIGVQMKTSALFFCPKQEPDKHRR